MSVAPRIGISTYALFWECSERNPEPIGPGGMLDRAAELGCNVLQICDYRPIEHLEARELAGLRRQAADLGVEIELGTRGVEVEHLRAYLDLCEALDAHMLRSMVIPDAGSHPTGRALAALGSLASELESRGVSIALETYEQLAVIDLVGLVHALASPRIGVALDPANSVARLEDPIDVIRRCAPITLNLHVKDFGFSRKDGWVGFTYAGAPMGTGLLDYAFEAAMVRPVQRGISQVVEHWLGWQGDITTTVDTEKRWTKSAIEYIKERIDND
ncbi:TIM barrel protein [Brooklawnia cerclae]|uniref:Sugar phosphate isomerase/epimerase n=1 Tax=Brooklawnia cerclae TaxID=349934 RepID=A0ABX0SHR6_9ACTN|nr:TIM barrel protein [Brooklawnia cerclae]NIH57434.1 sugar phosphate isomerase/epimerase [Brooklawnia cerclae]